MTWTNLTQLFHLFQYPNYRIWQNVFQYSSTLPAEASLVMASLDCKSEAVSLTSCRLANSVKFCIEGKDWTLFCFTFLKAFPGQCCFGRSVHLGCWVAASHLVLKLEWVRSCQRLDWEIWMQAGNSCNSFSQIGTVRKTLENHNYFRQNTKFASFLNIM